MRLAPCGMDSFPASVQSPERFSTTALPPLSLPNWSHPVVDSARFPETFVKFTVLFLRPRNTPPDSVQSPFFVMATVPELAGFSNDANFAGPRNVQSPLFRYQSPEICVVAPSARPFVTTVDAVVANMSLSEVVGSPLGFQLPAL